MPSNPLLSSAFRPSFSGHQTFPLRYGWLKKAYDAVAEAGSDAEAAHVFRDDASIARFGVGRNMVASMRHWSEASGVVEAVGDAGLRVSRFGDLLFGANGIDPYSEEESSLWLFHWNIVTRPKLTTWYWLFNLCAASTFRRQEAIDTLMILAREREWPRVAETTVRRDVECLVRAYVGGRGEGHASHDETRDSLLSELGLIRPVARDRFLLSRGPKPSLRSAVFLHALADFWDEALSGQSTASFEAIGFAPGSPGRVFLLDEESLYAHLLEIETLSKGALTWSETAGLRQVVKTRAFTIDERYAALASAFEADERRAAA